MFDMNMHDYLVTFHFYTYVVQPLQNKPPVIQIFNKNDNSETFSALKYNESYTVKWNFVQLNKVDFNQSGDFTLTLENHLFGEDLDKWFTPRIRGGTFLLDYVNKLQGVATFIQRSSLLRSFHFANRVIVLLKKTKYLTIMYTSSLFTFLSKPEGLALKSYCNLWLNTTKEPVSSNLLTSCPCSVQSIKFDNEYFADTTCLSEESPCHENIGAVSCYVKELNNS